MTRDDTKGDISRDNLKRHGIFFHSDDYLHPNDHTQHSLLALPEYIEAVREGLLVMENFIPREWAGQLREEFTTFGTVDLGLAEPHELPPSAYIQEKRHHVDKRKHSAEWEMADQNLERCVNIAQCAQEQLKVPEAEWNLFWRTHVFKNFNEEARTKSEHK